jgi:hypothetical protein
VLEVEPLEPGKPGGGGSGRVVVTRRDPAPRAAAAALGSGVAAAGKPGSRTVGYRLSDVGPAFLSQQQATNIL